MVLIKKCQCKISRKTIDFTKCLQDKIFGSFNSERDDIIFIVYWKITEISVIKC